MEDNIEKLPRDLLQTEDFRLNRIARIPIQISFTHVLRADVSCELSYIPHKLLLVHESVETWLDCYRGADLPLESLAAQIIDDVNNEVIPYWTSVTLLNSQTGVKIFAEDCQPTWRGKTIIIPEVSQRSFNRLMKR